MLINLPKLIKRFTAEHKNVVLISSTEAIGSFADNIQYAIFPVIAMALFDEWTAGLIVSAFTLFQLFIVDPLGGNLADKIGARTTLRLSAISFILGSLAWIAFGDSLLTIIFSGLFLFIGYSLNTIDSYILRVTPEDEGGLAFGIQGNIDSIGCFLATISIPFFLPVSMHIWIAVLVIVAKLICLLGTFLVDEDTFEREEKESSVLEMLNPLSAVRHGIHFIKMNGFYPVLALGSSLFEGLFYGTIWFIFPIHFAKLGLEGGSEGLQLGIYEIITMFLAGYAGYLADKYNWKHIHSFGWACIGAGVLIMPFYPNMLGLVIVGVIIGIGNNLSYYAAEHVLEKYDIDHREDGAFSSLRRMVCNIGYAVAPIVAGFMYSKYGFQVSLWYIAVTCSVLAAWMMWQTYRFEEKESNA